MRMFQGIDLVLKVMTIKVNNKISLYIYQFIKPNNRVSLRAKLNHICTLKKIKVLKLKLLKI